MDREEMKPSEAAASLTVEDFRYLQEHAMVPDHAPEDVDSGNARTTVVRAPTKRRRRRNRGQVKHEWPDVGTILEADYEGVHYEAEVIAAPRLKSGKAVRILTGPSAGQASSSGRGTERR